MYNIQTAVLSVQLNCDTVVMHSHWFDMKFDTQHTVFQLACVAC